MADSAGRSSAALQVACCVPDYSPTRNNDDSDNRGDGDDGGGSHGRVAK